VPQVLNLRLQDSALGGFQLPTGTSESFKNLPQTTDMRLEVRGDHDDVIEIDQQHLPVEPTEDLFHESLKGGRGGGQPKGQHLPFPQSAPCDERRLLLCVGAQRDLPVSDQQV